MIHEPTCVLLHGFGSSSREWAHVAEVLSGVRPFHPDLPGFGTNAQDAWRGVSAAADAVLDAVSRLNGDPYVLVGRDLGASVALAVAARAPQGLLGLALLAPPSPAENPGEVLLTAHGNADVLRTYYRELTNGALDERDLENVVLDGLRANPSAWTDWLSGGHREDLVPLARQVRVPTQVLVTRSDPALPWVEQHLLPNLSQGQLDVLDGDGRLLPLERPRDVTRHLLHWINEHVVREST